MSPPRPAPPAATPRVEGPEPAPGAERRAGVPDVGDPADGARVPQPRVGAAAGEAPDAVPDGLERELRRMEVLHRRALRRRRTVTSRRGGVRA